MKQGYRVIDADAHVIEPSDLWERYLEAASQSTIYVNTCVMDGTLALGKCLA